MLQHKIFYKVSVDVIMSCQCWFSSFFQKRPHISFHIVKYYNTITIESMIILYNVICKDRYTEQIRYQPNEYVPGKVICVCVYCLTWLYASIFLVKRNRRDIKYFTCCCEHMKNSDTSVLKETMRQLQLLPGLFAFLIFAFCCLKIYLKKFTAI